MSLEELARRNTQLLEEMLEQKKADRDPVSILLNQHERLVGKVLAVQDRQFDRFMALLNERARLIDARTNSTEAAAVASQEASQVATAGGGTPFPGDYEEPVREQIPTEEVLGSLSGMRYVPPGTFGV